MVTGSPSGAKPGPSFTGRAASGDLRCKPENHKMKLEDARRFALSLPETTEAPHFDKQSFRVGGKIFATVPADGDHLHVFVEEHETRAAVAEQPQACEELWWGRKLVGVRVTLSAADPQLVCELLDGAWRLRAPKRVEAQFDAAQGAGGAG